ncbi:MAG: flavodoxin family protein [Muribaculaceae bacterium]|nr:flavodoxin family protein [Muribaculaceae bacterium]
MKVLVLNGSPHLHGSTARALTELETTLHEHGIETERIEIGKPDIRGCIACNYCYSHGECVFKDLVNDVAKKFAEADGLVVGTPVYWAHSNGQALAFLDRLFYSTFSTIDKTMKVGAAVISSRRAGSTSAMEEINKYFTMNSMPVVSSTYWNEVHGSTAEETEKDLEGLQTMRNLGRNMAFLIKAIRAEKERTGSLPQQEHTYFTNFIR